MTGPLFICGLPRAGTTVLWQAFRRHPEFVNPDCFGKEPHVFEKFLGNRPWVDIDAQPPQTRIGWAKFEAAFERRGIALIDEMLRAHLGGPNGRYVTGYPNDVFHISTIHEHVGGAKFVIALRDPLENIWSMMNYRQPEEHTPAASAPIGEYKEDLVWHWARQWSKVVLAANEVMESPARSACMIVEHRNLIAKPKETVRAIADLAEIEVIPKMLRHVDSRLVHSSFSAKREEISLTEKIAHFDAQRAEAARYPIFLAAARGALESTSEARVKLGLRYKVLKPASVSNGALS